MISTSLSPRSCLPIIAALLLSQGCGGSKPTQAECNKFADHMVVLLKKAGHPAKQAEKLADDQRDATVNDCVAEGTAKEVQCVLAANSLEEVEKNCK